MNQQMILGILIGIALAYWIIPMLRGFLTGLGRGGAS